MSEVKEIYAKHLASFNQNGNLYSFTDDAREVLYPPSAWNSIFQGAPTKNWIQSILDVWKPLSKKLPNVVLFIKENILKIFILKELSGRSSILYPHTTAESSDFHFYKGFLPLSKIEAEKYSHWQNMPEDLKKFYLQIHNGWTYFADNAMGPLPMEDIEPISNYIDLLPADMAKLPFNAECTYGVFHNGAGDYLCLNLANKVSDVDAEGYIWWHERPEELEQVDFWAVMNAWMGIFFENAEIKRSLQ